MAWFKVWLIIPLVVSLLCASVYAEHTYTRRNVNSTQDVAKNLQKRNANSNLAKSPSTKQSQKIANDSIKSYKKATQNTANQNAIKSLDSTEQVNRLQSRQNHISTLKTSPNPTTEIAAIVKEGISTTTITLSSLGGTAIAGGLGGGIFALIKKDTKSPANDVVSNETSYFVPSTISIGVVDSGFNSTQISQQDKNFYDLGVQPPSQYDPSHGTSVAKAIRAYNTTSNLYMYSARCGNKGICPSVAMYNELYARDARVINASWGAMVDDKQTHITAGQFNSYYNNTMYYNMAKEASSRRIFVFAAGNQSSRHANIQSSLPLVAQKVNNRYNYIDHKMWENARRGWIAVTSTANWNNLLDTRYANWIGEDAKNWGIATKPYGGLGTSFSAPVVSAVVANVWNRFAWMSNHLVTQTILSTADKYTIATDSDVYNSSGDVWHKDVVTDGPNKKTGWGILNENRALKGPARFDTRLLVSDDMGQVQINFAYQNYEDLNRLTFSNDIAGDAGLHKYGNGTLYMSGSNTYTGATDIDDGALVLSNALLNSNITINTNGTLRTQDLSFLPQDSKQPNAVTLGTLNTNYAVRNYGVFEVFKDTILNGDYVSNGKSTLSLDVDAKLEVKGSADMSGGTFMFASLSRIPSASFQTKTLLTAQNGVKNWNGTWDVSQYSSAFLKVSDVKLSSLQNDIKHNLEVTYKRDSVKNIISRSMGYVPQNLENIGIGLDNALDTLAESNENHIDSNAYNEALSLMSVDLQNAPIALASLSGEVYDSSLVITHKSSILLNRTIARRLSQIASSNTSGVWADISYAKSTLRKQGYADGKISQYALMTGIDGIKDNKNSSIGLGAIVSINKSKGDFGIVGKSDMLSYGISLYALASYKSFYGLVRLGANVNNTNTTRKLNFGSEASLQNKQNDMSYHGYVEAGFNFDMGIFRFTPFIAWEEDFITRKRVSENGIDDNGSSFALTLDSAKHRVYSAIYGAKGFLDFGKFDLEYSVLNMYAPKPSNFSSKASFTGIDSVKFTSSGISQARNLIFITLGASYTISSFILRGEYSLSLNPSNKKMLEDEIFNLNIRYGF